MIFKNVVQRFLIPLQDDSIRLKLTFQKGLSYFPFGQTQHYFYLLDGFYKIFGMLFQFL